jgi:lipoprotein-releasing system permease protein
MNFSSYIARKVAFSGKKSFSRLIIRIATFAVALSVAIMIITTAVVRGFKNQISDKIFGLWGQIHITDASINQSAEITPVDMKQAFYPSLDTLRQLSYLVPNPNLFTSKSDPYISKITKGGIRHIQVFATKSGIIKTKEEIEGIVLKGAGRDFDTTFMQKSLLEGRFIQFKDSTASRDIIVSQYTANRLKIKVNDKFVIHFLDQNQQQLKRAFMVCGIYKTGLEEYDKKIAFVDLTIIQELLGWKKNQVAGFEVFVDNFADIEPLTEHIHNEVLPNNLYAETIRDKFPSIFEWLDLQNVNEIVIIVLMAIVAIINMITALLILILERTEMIGILKSFGANNWTIRKIFLHHAAIIVSVGLFFGNFFGLLVCFIQEKYKFIKLSETDYYLSYAPIELHLPTILLLNFATLFLVVLFLIVPTYLITRISPVKAIRMK